MDEAETWEPSEEMLEADRELEQARYDRIRGRALDALFGQERLSGALMVSMENFAKTRGMGLSEAYMVALWTFLLGADRG